MSSSSLGIYIDEGLIKYAKLVQDNDNIKVESYNIVFFENLKSEIEKIIAETGSFKIPIIVGLSSQMLNDPKQLKRTENAFTGKKIKTIKLVSDSLVNIVDSNLHENVAIIDLEKQTSITTIYKGNVVAYEVLDLGMEQILEKITEVENSERKSYEVCKNTTIYTNETNDFYSNGNEHISDIMPTLQKIIYEVKNYIDNLTIDINEIYLSGLGSAINNIDLYFQEYIPDKICEILKPAFIENNNFLLKDYIEVNSAIGLALDGLENKPNNVKVKDEKVTKKEKKKYGAFDKLLVRINVILILFIGVYLIFSSFIMNRINSMNAEIESSISTLDSEIDKANSDVDKIKSQAEKYAKLTEKVNNMSNTEKEKISKGAIPNALKSIANVVPKEVKILSIKNVSGKHVVIEVSASSYDQIGAFSAAISNGSIMQNVKASDGESVGNSNQVINANEDWIYVTIEGDIQ